jgi:20S proteasome alpha/beta subunit
MGASDRMLTAGDIQFEPEQPKVVPVSTSIVIMYAGDSAVQAEVLLKVVSDIVERIKKEPKNW